MKFDIPLPCFFGQTDFSEALTRVADCGLDAVEIYGWQTLNADTVRRAQEATGVRLLSMCTTRFDLTAPEKRAEWLSGLRETLAAAKAMGVGKLITQVGPDTGAERAYQHESIVRGLSAAKPLLEEAGVVLMIEPLNTLVNHPGYYLWQASEAFAIVREVDSFAVKVVYDIYHQQVMEGNIIPTVTNNLDCIAHLHAAGHPGRIDLQLGELDYKNVFAAIDKAGYTGYCGLEYRPTLPPEEDIETFKKFYLA